MDNPTAEPDSGVPRPEDAVVHDGTPEPTLLPEAQHFEPNEELPPLIGDPAPPSTLDGNAGRPIVPEPPLGARPWQPGEPWRPGGGLFGHDRDPAAAEPLAGSTPPHAPAAAAPPVYLHEATPVPTPASPRSWLLGVLAGALGGVVTALAFFAAGAFDTPQAQPVPPQDPGIIQVTEIISPEGDISTAAAVGQKVVPSIVTVEIGSENAAGVFNVFGSGSGVVMTADGRVITNRHVIADADRVRVVFQDGRIYQADVRGTDELTDLAVLDINAANLVPIELGASRQLRIGDPAIAIGNPLGLEGGASLTVGVISAFDREVRVGPDASDRLFGMLQTDAPITRGSSGGALVDGSGRLIGITTAIGVSDAGAEGVGFAIPVELVVRITDELAERGEVSHAFLGVRLEDFLRSDGSAQVPAGATIVSVESNSSAEEFGLEVGDRVIRLDELDVRTSQDIVNALRLYRVGDTIELKVVRDGAEVDLAVVLGERPDDI